ncbi:pickpocket protein 28-like [Zophobas morio]|uniref:pickpocket protein 28-like n=1 Tax=Zophobas morio TaxID=2755281 RepID=UPI003083D0E4
MTNSSIHGLKYLVGKERTLIEKSLWLAVLSVSIYTCSLLIKSAWQKWEECPVVVGFGQTPVRMWEIPFPAVTICSEYEYNRESNVTVKYLVRKKGWQVGKMSVYCDSEANGIYPHETVFEAADYYEGPEWEEFLVGTALLSEQIFAFCQWGWKYSCADIFFPVITEHGICFSFNMLDKNDLFRDTSYIADALGNQDDISHWTFDKNYDETNDDVYPRRSETISEKLEVGLKSYLEKVACLGFDKFFMMIHHPADTPSMRRAFELETNKSHEILITPQVVVSSENLRSYSPQRKKCYFPEDRYLYFYKIYTVENCKRECLANYTLSKCGCVPYYLPRNYIFY